MLALIAMSFLAFVLIAYRFYSSFLARIFAIEPSAITPAHQKRDDQEYLPTRPFYLFSQHFSAIAASGPIAGPILAAQKWGWFPCLLWIALGVVFIGAAHDYAALVASVRHGACSVAHIAKTRIGEPAGRLFLLFIWLALVYVIVAFVDVTAATFVSASEELTGININFNPGGAVAASAIYYLILCIVMGVVERYMKPPLWLSTIIFVPLVFAMIWLGTNTSTLFIFSQQQFAVAIIVYCFIAAMLPIWLLLQPRGYLGGFVLFFVLAIGIYGIIFGNYEIKQPAIIENASDGTFNMLFPFLFVTIACGACSGFHGLVCSGTTAKQIDKEQHMRPIGYGCMLAEALVAIIALACIMIFSVADVAGFKPGTIYGRGIGEFLTQLVGEQNRLFAVTFGAMAFSTFVFDTLDVATRLGRYLFTELFEVQSRAAQLFGTALTLCIPLTLLFNGSGQNTWISFWTVFGSANQLLAGLTLATMSVWLWQTGKNYWVTLLPMFFVLCTTIWALGNIAWVSLRTESPNLISYINAGVAVTLIILAVVILSYALKSVALKISATHSPSCKVS